MTLSPKEVEALLDAERSAQVLAPAETIDRVWAGVSASAAQVPTQLGDQGLSTLTRLKLLGGAAVLAGGVLTLSLFGGPAPEATKPVVSEIATIQSAPALQPRITVREVASTPGASPDIRRAPKRSEMNVGMPPVSGGKSTFDAARRADPRAELELLEQARAALTAGDGSGAQRLLHRHEVEFGSAAMFVEEKESLEVSTLLELGALDAADAAARRFLSKYPRTIHRQSVEAALRK
jgi:hypothetical protein